MIKDWRLVLFEPLDVLVNADARGLDDGGTGQPGPISPVAFAGALRTLILKQAGTQLGDPRGDSAEVIRAKEFIGFAGEPPPDGFRFLGPLHRLSESHEVLFPCPRLAVADDTDVRRATQEAKGFWSQNSLVVGSDRATDGSGLLILNEPAAGRWAPAGGLVTARDLVKYLAGATAGQVFPEAACFGAERRTGHERAASGLPADHTLHSRSALRPRQSVGLSGLSSAVYAGLLKDPATEWLGGNSPLAARLAGDGHVACLDILSAHDTEQRLGPFISLAEQFAEPLEKRSNLLLYLATPAIFDAGWHPPYGHEEGVQLVAAAVGRPQLIGGWDMQHGRPKPLYRAVPAGSVYLYEVTESGRATALARSWLNLDSVSSFYPTLGFGWGIPGRWPGRNNSAVPGSAGGDV
jgi:CRISPR-associated protein (Cas_Cmr3)